jgi:hypothetical protein
MGVLIRPVVNGLDRFLMFGESDSLERANFVAKNLMRFHVANAPDEVRLCAQAMNLHTIHNLGIDCRPGLCGSERICQMNLKIVWFRGEGFISRRLKDASMVLLSCQNFGCECHPEHLLYEPRQEVAVFSPRFLGGE